MCEHKSIEHGLFIGSSHLNDKTVKYTQVRLLCDLKKRNNITRRYCSCVSASSSNAEEEELISLDLAELFKSDRPKIIEQI